ncbi:MAG: PUA domain-containing protein [Candidatus Micrarchaeota archaeon]
MSKRTLNKKEVRDLTLDFFDLDKDNNPIIEEIEERGKPKILVIDKVPIAVQHEGRWIATLKGIRKPIKKISVDEGAIKFVLAGAHIMRPGITKIEDGIQKDEVVIILDHNNKPLATGIALFTSEEMKAMAKGKVIVNVHQINDWIWNYNSIQ